MAHPTMARIAAERPWIGRLAEPKAYHRMDDTAACGIVWAADNRAYSGWDEDAFVRMLDHLEGVPGCKFLAAPDVVADSEMTLERFRGWLPELAGRGLPLALVAQDGLKVDEVPWSDIAALFVGGSTLWKLGQEAELLVHAAKERGLWVHMGRVNTLGRIAYARALGCDSVDGSKWSRWRDTWLADTAAVCAPPQLRFEGVR